MIISVSKCSIVENPTDTKSSTQPPQGANETTNTPGAAPESLPTSVCAPFSSKMYKNPQQERLIQTGLVL